MISLTPDEVERILGWFKVAKRVMSIDAADFPLERKLKQHLRDAKGIPNQ